MTPTAWGRSVIQLVQTVLTMPSVVANLSASLRYLFRVAQCTKTLCTPAEQAAAMAAQGIATGAHK